MSVIRFGILGCAAIARKAFIPALRKSARAELVAVASRTSEKAEQFAAEFNCRGIVGYDKLLARNDIDAVYIALPIGLHARWTIAAAERRKHVLCEKTFTTNPQDTLQAIKSCERNDVALYEGFSYVFHPQHEYVRQAVGDGVIGKPVVFEAKFGIPPIDSPIRYSKALGGGAMMDMGVYSLQATRYVTGEEPVSIQAQTRIHRPDMFEAEETMTFQLEFPGGTFANCHTSFNANVNVLHASAEKGWFRLDPFQAYRGIKGNSSDGPLDFPVINQQAQQMDEVALSIINNQPMRVPGEEGLKDMIVVDAAYESARTGKKILI